MGFLLIRKRSGVTSKQFETSIIAFQISTYLIQWRQTSAFEPKRCKNRENGPVQLSGKLNKCEMSTARDAKATAKAPDGGLCLPRVVSHINRVYKRYLFDSIVRSRTVNRIKRNIDLYSVTVDLNHQLLHYYLDAGESVH